jgi:26 proteasome complex subunit DSS1
MSSDKPAGDVGLLEEDDEFEEFPTDEWDENCEDEEDINVWEDKWDDDNVQVEKI